MGWIDINDREPEVGQKILAKGLCGALRVAKYVEGGTVNGSGTKMRVAKWSTDFETPYDPAVITPKVGERVLYRGEKGAVSLGRMYRDVRTNEKVWENVWGMPISPVAWGYPPED